ncbi:hypothetical protein N7462_010103 [Penicillium macrosclerotiorum]|uniref:uncharacterized protein n=1 Tax=Penicillium macrosclerotiorum TaxID=303699 RepID=UPI002546AF0B|nr:uncharacterized protein N7462_010103 [Penicillium macrosclerotiorum]KAJ5669033.1 hypothetical protein N7462_010103 [Penicillium macrosclerotiorum]
MGIIRMPRPAGIYVPNSPSHHFNNDMIPTPLSPDFDFDSEAAIPSILPALEYISTKLQQRMMHVTLLVGRGQPFPTGQVSDMMVIPITPLDAVARGVLERAMAKSANKFSLSQSWTDALNRSNYECTANEFLVQQSIKQNEVIFSQEGLTLLNMDRIFIFKRRLCVLSSRPFFFNDHSITPCVKLLHRIINDQQGRPFTKAFFHRIYDHLDVKDDLLREVARTYKSTHGQDAIILPSEAMAPPAQRPSGRITRPQAPASTKPSSKSESRKVRGMKSISRSKRGPKTPLSASDVTPITRNEWNILMGQDIGKPQPMVTELTPTSSVYVLI